MNIQVNNDAAKWYKSEMNLKAGDFVRFFVRYGGCSTVQEGFSLGLANDPPNDVGVKTEVDGITYYVEEKDLWYFDGHDLQVTLNEKHAEPEFHFSK